MRKECTFRLLVLPVFLKFHLHYNSPGNTGNDIKNKLKSNYVNFTESC